MDWPSRARRAAPLAAILALAAVFRLSGINFGLPHLNCRPDEGGIVSVAGGMALGNLNPHVFNYPALFMLAVGFVLAVLTATGLAEGGSLTAPYRIARHLSAGAGIASVLMVFTIGARLFGRAAGLAAAALLSLSFLHVRDSHFGVTDVPMTFMVLLAFLFIVRLSESGRRNDLIAAGITAGLATSTKYNAAIVVLPALVAIFTMPGAAAPQPHYARLRHVAVFASLMVGAFLIASPYTILDFPSFMRDFTFESRHLAGGHEVDLGRGWRHHIVSNLRYGVGLPVLVAGVAGFVLLLWRDSRKGALLVTFPLAYFLVIGSGRTVFARYMLPVIPFLCLAAGYAVTETATWIAQRTERPRLAPMLATALVIAIIWPSAQSVFAFSELITLDDNRLLAKRWVERHIPAGTAIAQYGPEGGHVFLFNSLEVEYEKRQLAWRGENPGVVIVQSSPLVPVPADLAWVERLLPRYYDLAFDRHGVGSDPANVYDWQDQFFLPLAGFKNIERPGPNLKIYVRRGRFPDVPRLADRLP